MRKIMLLLIIVLTFTIEGINPQENIELFDLTGRLILKQDYNNGINISELKRGIYILKLNNQNYKIIKE